MYKGKISGNKLCLSEFIGYDENGLPVPEKYPQIPDLAASGLWSTPEELLIIAREFVNACNGNSSLLKNKTAHEMVKPIERFPWMGIGLLIIYVNDIRNKKTFLTRNEYG